MKTVLMAITLVGVMASALAAKRSEIPAPLLKEAKLDVATARKVALKVRPGSILKEELEKEKGGSGLRYSFDIKSGKHVWEVGVDAATGKVLENALDDHAKD